MNEAIEKVIDKTTVETVEEVVERPYTLRKLADEDLFPLLQLIRQLGFKDFKNAFVESRKKATFNSNAYESEDEKEKALDNFKEATGINVFMDMADVMISKIATHKDAIYEFYSNLSGIPADDIKKMEFGTLPLMIYDSFSEVKNTSFFKVLSKLL